MSNESERMCKDAVVCIVIRLWAKCPRSSSVIRGRVGEFIMSSAVPKADSATRLTSNSVKSEAFFRGGKTAEA